MYSSRRYSRDYLLPSSVWYNEDNNNHHPYALTTSHSTSSMLRSCSNFIHRFSSRLKIQNNANESNGFAAIHEREDREKSQERSVKPEASTTLSTSTRVPCDTTSTVYSSRLTQKVMLQFLVLLR